MLGVSSTPEIVQNLTTRVRNNIQKNTTSLVINSINNNQSIVLNTGSNGGSVSHLSQHSAFNSVQEALRTTTLNNDIFSKAEFETLAKLYNEQNTLDSLGNVVVKATSTLAKMFNSVLGKVVIFTVAIVVAIFSFLFFYGIYRAYLKNYTGQGLKEAYQTVDLANEADGENTYDDADDI
jgi:H+/gluconate symporter-like permease